MPKAISAKTASALDSRQALVAITLLLAAVAAVACSLSRASRGRATANIAEQLFSMDIAATSAKREQGLSGRPGLGQHEGMIFVFDQPGLQCFWMKDMHFSLDMIWLDEQKKVVSIKKDVQPETYPESFCADARYVLEVNAGTTDAAGLSTGQQVELNL